MERFVACEAQLDDLIFQMEEAVGAMRKMEGKSVL